MGELRAISFVNLQRVYNPQSLVLSDISPRKLSQTPKLVIFTPNFFKKTES